MATSHQQCCPVGVHPGVHLMAAALTSWLLAGSPQPLPRARLFSRPGDGQDLLRALLLTVRMSSQRSLSSAGVLSCRQSLWLVRVLC
jgi:hypothetical protein